MKYIIIPFLLIFSIETIGQTHPAIYEFRYQKYSHFKNGENGAAVIRQNNTILFTKDRVSVNRDGKGRIYKVSTWSKKEFKNRLPSYLYYTFDLQTYEKARFLVDLDLNIVVQDDETGSINYEIEEVEKPSFKVYD